MVDLWLGNKPPLTEWILWSSSRLLWVFILVHRMCLIQLLSLHSSFILESIRSRFGFTMSLLMHLVQVWIVLGAFDFWKERRKTELAKKENVFQDEVQGEQCLCCFRILIYFFVILIENFSDWWLRKYNNMFDLNYSFSVSIGLQSLNIFSPKKILE